MRATVHTRSSTARWALGISTHSAPARTNTTGRKHNNSQCFTKSTRLRCLCDNSGPTKPVNEEATLCCVLALPRHIGSRGPVPHIRETHKCVCSPRASNHETPAPASALLPKAAHMRNDTRAYACSDNVTSPWSFSQTSADAVPELIVVTTSVSVHIQHTHTSAH